MADTDMVVVLRNQKGDIYLITQAILESGKVPDNKKAAVEAALTGEVAGYLFNNNTFQNAFTGLSQNNTNIGSNVLIGGVLGGNVQSLSQAGVNVGQASTTQVKGYPFEVGLPRSNRELRGVILADQVKSLDWRARQAVLMSSVPDSIVEEVVGLIGRLLY